MTNNDKSQILPFTLGTDRRQTGAAKTAWFVQVLVEPHAALNGWKKSHLVECTVVFASRLARDSFSLEGLGKHPHVGGIGFSSFNAS